MYFLVCKYTAFLGRAFIPDQDGGVHTVKNDHNVNYILFKV